ncbi:MAG: FISUMP domain-containing protein [Bacteroidota bacterium]
MNHSGQCVGDSINFSFLIWPPADSLTWNFGDPASGGSNVSNLIHPKHKFTSTGNFVVTLIARHIDKRVDTTIQSISIKPSPAPFLGADQTICIGDSVTFDAGVCSGCTYQWSNLTTAQPNIGTGQTYKTGEAAVYMVSVTSPNGCIGRDTVQLFTSPLPVVMNNPLSKSICSGESTNISLTSNVPGTMFHWTTTLTSGNITGFNSDSGLVINQTLVNHLATPGIVTYHITPKVGSCSGSPEDFAVTVNPGDSAKVSITASANNICAGTSVIFTAFPINPGTTPIYQWKVNGVISGSNSPTFSYNPLHGDLVKCVLTSSISVCISNNPATSNTITMIVNPNLPVSVLVSPAANPVCEGTSVTFTATPTFGGLVPGYQWKVNGFIVGGNSPIYSYIPLNNDVITCKLTSSETCVTGNPAISNQVIMTVNPNLPVSISISASSNPFCIGGSVTFTANPTHGGTTPLYQWKVNGLNVGFNNSIYTYSPISGDVVTCVLTSSDLCVTGNPATSNTITMIGNLGLPAGITINASPNPFCPGTAVTFTATPNNGGPNPVYQWKVNGTNAGTNSSTYSYNPLTGDKVACVMTSNLACVSGNPAQSNEITLSGTLAPIVSFTTCFDTVTTVNAKPIKLKGGIPLNGTYSGLGVSSNIFTPSAAGIGTKTITYTYTNAVLCSASKTRTILVQAAPAFSCGNNMTDIRDGKSYATVQIGLQCWMASNLNYGNQVSSIQHQRDNCVNEKYCYQDLTANCAVQGANYQWDELMRYDDTSGPQGLCPPGWHVPTEAEWNTLFSVYISNGFAGSPLKYSGYSGFNALLSGVNHFNRQWDFNGFATFFWSSTAHGSLKAWARGMNDYNPSVSVYPSSRANAFSVRCCKD